MKTSINLHGITLFLLATILLLLQGCYFTAVPLTVREIRDYTMPSKQTVSAPINRVARAACTSLAEMGFSLKRVEYRTDPAIIEAIGEEVSIDLHLTGLTDRATLVRSKVMMESGSREFSLEEELYANIRSSLQGERVPSISELVKGLTPIFAAPSADSARIGFVRPGEKLQASDSGEEEWLKVAMKSGAEGYMAAALVKE